MDFLHRIHVIFVCFLDRTISLHISDLFLQMSNNFPSGSSAEELGGMNSDQALEDMTRPPTSSAHELIEIQKIQNSLLSDFETQASSVSGPGQLPPYPAVSVSSFVCGQILICSD